MSQISKIRLTNDNYERIFKLFIETLLNIKDRKRLDGFIQNFFTPTERIVFAKRLAACVMLAKGSSYQNIRETLRISPPTIARMSARINYEESALTDILNGILKKDAVKILFEELSGVLDIPGKGRSYSGVKKSMADRQKKIRKLTTQF